MKRKLVQTKNQWELEPGRTIKRVCSFGQQSSIATNNKMVAIAKAVFELLALRELRDNFQSFAILTILHNVTLADDHAIQAKIAYLVLNFLLFCTNTK